MTELFVLVNRPVAGQAQQTVNARELHAFLESKQEFSNWIKNRIEDYGFLDGVDFLTNLSKTQGRPRIDYFLSLDMAKELSMGERNEKGKRARQYFIDCEKRLSGSLKIDFNDPLQAAKGSQCLRESAKLLKWQQTPFIDWLLVKKMLFRDAGKQLCVYQEYLGRGWFEYRTDEKNGHAFKQVMVTPLGLQKLAQKLEVVA